MPPKEDKAQDIAGVYVQQRDYASDAKWQNLVKCMASEIMDIKLRLNNEFSSQTITHRFPILDYPEPGIFAFPYRSSWVDADYVEVASGQWRVGKTEVNWSSAKVSAAASTYIYAEWDDGPAVTVKAGGTWTPASWGANVAMRRTLLASRDSGGKITHHWTGGYINTPIPDSVGTPTTATSVYNSIELNSNSQWGLYGFYDLTSVQPTITRNDYLPFRKLVGSNLVLSWIKGSDFIYSPNMIYDIADALTAATGPWSGVDIISGTFDHGSLFGLADDDHPDYALLTGSGARNDNSVYFVGRQLLFSNGNVKVDWNSDDVTCIYANCFIQNGSHFSVGANDGTDYIANKLVINDEDGEPHTFKIVGGIMVAA